jgi:hypothetical protein
MEPWRPVPYCLYVPYSATEDTVRLLLKHEGDWKVSTYQNKEKWCILPHGFRMLDGCGKEIFMDTLDVVIRFGRESISQIRNKKYTDKLETTNQNKLVKCHCNTCEML